MMGLSEGKVCKKGVPMGVLLYECVEVADDIVKELVHQLGF